MNEQRDTVDEHQPRPLAPMQPLTDWLMVRQVDYVPPANFDHVLGILWRVTEERDAARAELAALRGPRLTDADLVSAAGLFQEAADLYHAHLYQHATVAAALARGLALVGEVERLRAQLARSIRMPPTDPQTRLGQWYPDRAGRLCRIIGHEYDWKTGTWRAMLTLRDGSWQFSVPDADLNPADAKETP